MSAARPALLSVWNPLHEPRTVEVHVEHLRHRKTTWWGRIYGRPREVQTQAPSANVISMIDASVAHVSAALAEHGEVMLLVTNHASLHALRVTAMRDGSERPPLDELPDYYRDRQVILWFRVADVRALSYDQVSTLEYLREAVRFDRHVLDTGRAPGDLHPYDPFASMAYRFPLPILLDAGDGLFASGLQDGFERFVDRPDAAFPRPILAELDQLARDHPELWRGLRRPAQLLLANGCASLRALGETSFGFGPAVLGVAGAVECELRDNVFSALVAEPQGSERAALVRSLLANHRDELSSPRLTLGGMGIALGRVAKALRPSVDRLGCQTLVDLSDEHSDLAYLAKVRNKAAHAGFVRRDEYNDVWRRSIARKEHALLDRVVRARDEVAAVIAS